MTDNNIYKPNPNYYQDPQTVKPLQESNPNPSQSQSQDQGRDLYRECLEENPELKVPEFETEEERIKRGKALAKALARKMTEIDDEKKLAKELEISVEQAKSKQMEAEIIAFDQPQPITPPQTEFDDGDFDEDYTDDNEFSIVENWLLDHPDPRIKGEEIAIYTLLVKHAHYPKKVCWVSIVGLADRTGWDRPKVRRAINNLIAVGAVRRNDGEKQNSRPQWIIEHRHRPTRKKRARQTSPNVMRGSIS